MAPLLVTALVGVGVKIATDLLMSGAKEWFKPAGSTFASTLDKARTAVGPTAALATSKPPVATDAALADRARLLAGDVASEASAMARVQGAESYRRLSEIQAI